MKSWAVYLATGVFLLSGQSALSEPKPGPPADLSLPQTEEAPGYQDFKDAAPSPQEIEEQMKRRDDRNVVSPGMRDDQELQRDMGQE